MLLNCGVGEDSWVRWTARRSVLGVHWKDWCWNWNSNTLVTWCKELIHWKKPWCWERLRAGGEGDNKGWDDWIASSTRWRWVWVDSGSWWWTGRPGMLWFIGSQRVGHDEWLNWLGICFCSGDQMPLFRREGFSGIFMFTVKMGQPCGIWDTWSSLFIHWTGSFLRVCFDPSCILGSTSVPVALRLDEQFAFKVLYSLTDLLVSKTEML